MAQAAPFSRRYQVRGTAALLREIEQDRAALAEAIAAGGADSESLIRMRLGFDLIPIDREAEAVIHLEAALALAPKQANRAREIEVLLYLGTARQYLGERAKALELFREGIEVAQSTEIFDQVHFLLHHRGRCLVEMNRFAEARHDFEQALLLREKIGEPRFINSSRAALKDIEGR